MAVINSDPFGVFTCNPLWFPVTNMSYKSIDISCEKNVASIYRIFMGIREPIMA